MFPLNKRYDKTSEVKQHKKQIAHEILDKVEADIITDKLCKEFEEHYNVCNYQVADKDFNKACALEEFLIALKYKVRTIKIGKGGDKNEQ